MSLHASPTRACFTLNTYTLAIVDSTVGETLK